MVDAYIIMKSLEKIFSHPILLIIISCTSCLLKGIIFSYLIKQRISSHAPKRSLIFIAIVLLGAMAEDIAWTLTLLRSNLIPGFDYRPVLFFIRIAWVLYPLRYLTFSLFIESLIDNSKSLSLRQKLSLFITSCPGIILIGFALFDINCKSPLDRHISEMLLIRTLPLYTLCILMPLSLWALSKKLRTTPVPNILKKQSNVILKALLIPTLCMDFIQTFPMDKNFLSLSWVTNSYIFLGISNIFLSYMLFHCARRLIGIRFLNLTTHVQTPYQFNFIKNFTDILEYLGQAASIQEIRFITQELFQKAFHIPGRTISLYVCSNKISHLDFSPEQRTFAEKTIDSIINANDNQLQHELNKSKILIYDEIAFTHFYEQHDETQRLLQFLENIHADLFIPIYNQQKIIGCIIVERNSRPNIFYGNTECAEMIVFASYLGNIINLLQNRNFRKCSCI